MPRACSLACCLLLAASLTAQSSDDDQHGFDLSVVSFNVESDTDTKANVVATDIARIPESHLWGLSEVDASDFDSYRKAIGDRYQIIEGTTGHGGKERYDDHLAIVYDPEVLAVVGEAVELSDAGGTRHPLMARFEINGTAHEIIVVLNHLQRGKPGENRTRQRQARWLKDWAASAGDGESPHGIVLLGDYNFDVNILTECGNRAYRQFMEGDVFRWIEPACLAQGTCPPTGTGCHCLYSSILDFVFLAGAAKTWTATSEILFKSKADAYCAHERKGGSDHFPVRAVITLP